MKTIALVLFALLAAACNKEDGEPDPPVHELVPCHPDAGSDDPLACPPVDAGGDAAVTDAP
jgi:hypothetical protein